MTILKPNMDTQTFKIISTSHDINEITLRSEQEITKQKYKLDVDFRVGIGEWYVDIEFTDNYGYMREDFTYEMIVKDSSGEIVFLDKVFSTSQNISTFTNNLNVYEEHVTTNQYILYGE